LKIGQYLARLEAKILWRHFSGHGVGLYITDLSVDVGVPSMPTTILSVTLVYCGQTGEWIKMPLGTEVGLGPDHIVLDGHPAPPTERAQ